MRQTPKIPGLDEGWQRKEQVPEEEKSERMLCHRNILIREKQVGKPGFLPGKISKLTLKKEFVIFISVASQRLKL